MIVKIAEIRRERGNEKRNWIKRERHAMNLPEKEHNIWRME